MTREALVVGINRYPFLKQNKYGDLDLNAPATDAQDIAHILETYGDFRVQVLPEIYEGKQRRVTGTGTVKLDELQIAIANLFNPPDHRPADVALLFFAGHGWLTQAGGIQEGFLVTSNTSVNPKTQALRNGISLRWLRELLQESPVKQQVVWLDCCFSGELLNFAEADPGTGGKSDPDRCLITACRSFQTSQEEISGAHGVFTGTLLEALNPENHVDGWVTNYALVEDLNQRMSHTPQCPVFHNSGSAIILTTNRPEKPADTHLKGICPYRSLSYFTEKHEDAVFFHGRMRLTDELIYRVRTDNFIALLGASGSGKSSVLRAGLLYQLKLGQKISGSDRWQSS